jgi:hypothetical protein
MEKLLGTLSYPLPVFISSRVKAKEESFTVKIASLEFYTSIRGMIEDRLN